jgi:CDP-diacylglycerol--serine O-phosphatidyltransferase
MRTVMGGDGRRHFSMIRSLCLADLLTLANGACGVGAIFRAIRFVEGHDGRDLAIAAVLVVVALVFDVLDGRVARWRHEASALGREMDSLADVISFGVAPAAIAFAAGLRTTADEGCLVFFSVCGLARLARYNVTAEQLADAAGKVRYFEGTPIPTSIVPLGLFLLAYRHGALLPVQALGVEAHLVSLLFVASGCLMVSTVRIPKP